MRAWDIYSFQPPNWPEPHPAVIVSHPDRGTRPPALENAGPETREVYLSSVGTYPGGPRVELRDGEGMDRGGKRRAGPGCRF